MIWRLIDAIMAAKYMVRFGAWPGGNRNLEVYIKDEQYLYDGTLEEIETAALKDFGHLLTPKLPLPSKLPPLPGLPRV